VAVMPGLERPLDLNVAEAIVPAEVFNLCFPRDTDRAEGDGFEAEGEACAVACSHAGIAW